MKERKNLTTTLTVERQHVQKSAHGWQTSRTLKSTIRDMSFVYIVHVVKKQKKIISSAVS